MTPGPEESVYSSVSTLRSLHIVIFLAKLNGLKLMQGDIGPRILHARKGIFYCWSRVWAPCRAHLYHQQGTIWATI